MSGMSLTRPHARRLLRSRNSKLFEASRELIPVKDSVGFPTFAASCLAGGVEMEFPARLRQRVTMVGLFHRQFGYSMLPSWTEPFDEAFGASGERFIIFACVLQYLCCSCSNIWDVRFFFSTAFHAVD